MVLMLVSPLTVFRLLAPLRELLFLHHLEPHLFGHRKLFLHATSIHRVFAGVLRLPRL